MYLGLPNLLLLSNAYLGDISIFRNIPLTYTPALWLDGSDTSTIIESGGLVSQWSDKSGNGNHATQGNDSNKPTFVDESTGLLFDGISDHLIFDGSVLVNTDYTLFVVGERSDGNENYFLGGTELVINQNFHFGYASPTLFKSAHYSNDISFSVGSGDGYTSESYCTTLDGTNGRECFINNVSKGAIASTTKLSAYTGSSLGRYKDLFLNGVIKEVLIYQRAFNAQERTHINAYLTNKWGL